MGVGRDLNWGTIVNNYQINYGYVRAYVVLLSFNNQIRYYYFHIFINNIVLQFARQNI